MEVQSDSDYANMSYMSGRFFIILSLVSAIFLAVMMNITTPSDIGPFGVLVFFTLFYVFCLGITITLCRGVLMLKKKMQKKEVGDTTKKSYFYGSILAFAPILLVFMRSFGELNVLEILLVVLFVIVSCFYISKKA